MMRLLSVALVLALAGCAPSILHFGGGTQIAAPGEVPRDARGEPVWSAIRATSGSWRPVDATQAAPGQEGSRP